MRYYAPTVIKSDGSEPGNGEVAGEFVEKSQLPALPSNFPVKLNQGQMILVEERLKKIDFRIMSSMDVAMLGSEVDKKFHTTLDGFLAKIDEVDNTNLFRLLRKLSDGVERENLEAFADQILNDEPDMLDKLLSLGSKKALSKSVDNTKERLKKLMSDKTKTLMDLVEDMSNDVDIEQGKLQTLLENMVNLKDAYRDRFNDFIIVVTFVWMFFEQSKIKTGEFERTLGANDLIGSQVLGEMKSKLRTLESRALALEKALTRIAADQLLIAQLEEAGIETFLDVVTTIPGRIGEVKSTLLALHAALITRGVQGISEQSKQFGHKLNRVRAKVTEEVVTTAANAAGDNRLAEARSLRDIAAEIRKLAGIKNTAIENNLEKLKETRTILREVQQELVELGKGTLLNQDSKVVS
jgi:BMFP domain-containing protein YqiC